MLPVLLSAVLSAADPLPPDLAAVPTDAAVFAYADVAKLWNTKLGDTFRKTDALTITKTLSYFKQHAGITLADVKTITFWVAAQKDDGQGMIGVRVRTSKPLDRATILKEYKALLAPRKQDLKTVKEFVYQENDGTTLDLSDPTLFNLVARAKDAGQKPTSTAQQAAIALAAAGKPAVVGVNFDGFPASVRSEENVPPQLAPFRPFVLCNTAVGVFDLVGPDLTADVTFKADTRAKAVEAEKSLGAIKALVDIAIGQGLPEIEKEKGPAVPLTLAFAKAMREVAKKATITGDDKSATVALTAPADMDYSGFLELLFGKTGSAASRSVDANNLKQLALAMHNYASAYGDSFPPAATVGKKGKLLLSWRVAILPYVEQGVLYKKFNLDEPWDSTHNKKVFDENPMPSVFLHPAAGKDGDKTTHYQVFTGNGAAFDVFQGHKFNSFQDGTSNTILIATAKTPVEWTKPDDIAFDPKADPTALLLFSNDACNVAFADGSVRSLRNTIKAAALRGVITRSGGEVVNIDD